MLLNNKAWIYNYIWNSAIQMCDILTLGMFNIIIMSIISTISSIFF